jgi:hypothetical protein
LIERFHGAGTGDDGGLFAADFDIANAHDGVFLLEIPANEFIWFGNFDCLADSGEHFEVSRIYCARIACDSDGRPSCSRHRVRLESELADYFEDFVHLLLGGSGLHYY